MYLLILPVLALIGYLYYEIQHLKNKVDDMASQELLRKTKEELNTYFREKLHDTTLPIEERLNRIDERLEKIYDLLIKQ